MMTEAAVATPHPALPQPASGEWTYADLQAIPEDGPKWEIVEGSLHVSPSATYRHQRAAGYIWRLLDDAAPEQFAVTYDVDVDLGRNVFRPDVLVLTADAVERDRPFAASDLLLAVEVTSPSSWSMDRIIKPAALAVAGVPHYWRVDIEGDPYVEIFTLDAGAYRLTQTGRAGASLRVEQPFPMEFDPAVLVRN